MHDDPPRHLLHITHAVQDDAWVRGVVLPALGLADGQYWTRAEDDVGSLKLEELERAVRACRYTLLVASSAARVDQWVQFAGQLAQRLGVEEGKPRLLLVARDFAPGSERARELLPLRQRCLICLDCSDPARTAAALATLAALLALSRAEPPPPRCPYPGLRTFGAGDPQRFDRTDLFFGRDDEGRAVVERLRAGGRVLLVGPSGCGKSSLIHARVLPALGSGRDAMAIAIADPGGPRDRALREALEALDPRLAAAIDAHLASDDGPQARAALAAAAGGPRRLVCVDQLEQAFTEDGDDDDDPHPDGARLFARLAALTRVPGVAVLLGMRADFYGDLMRSPAWDDFKDHRVELAPLRGAALRLAIARPAEAVGVHVEADLVERLVREADLDRAAEALPLLQVALEQIWAYREWRYLSLASYERITDGERRGLDAVLARHADASVAALPGPAQRLAHRVLIDLVHLGEGRPDTRRRRTVSELRRAGDDPDALDPVLDALSARRLIAIGAEVGKLAAERHVDLAHDALITGWPALAGWIRARRDDLRTQRRLEARAAGGGVLAASELPEFTRWLAWLDTPEGRALGASEALRALVPRSVRLLRARRRRLITGLVGVIAVLAVATAVTRWQRDLATASAAEAERQHAQAEAEKQAGLQQLSASYQETGRQLVLADRPFEAVPYLIEAYRAVDAASPPLRMLFAAAARHLPVALIEHAGAVQSAAFSPDGTRIVTASDDHTARVWDAATGQALSPPLVHDGAVVAAAFSPDGARVVTASLDRTARVWDATTGASLPPHLAHDDGVTSAAFSPDGTRIVTASFDRTARIWDAATGRRLFPPLVNHGRARTWANSWDGTRIITNRAAFSPDGTRIVAVSDTTAQVWDAAAGTPVSPPLGHDSVMRSAAFSPDGTRVVTASNNDTARIWDIATGRPLSPPLAHDGDVVSAAFGPDGTRVVTASDDHTARIWDATTGKPVGTPLSHGDRVRSAAFSPDGTRIVTASFDRTARIWDAATGTPVGIPLVHDGAVVAAAFSPDGARVVTASADGTARVWRIATAVPAARPAPPASFRWRAMFGPDGHEGVTTSRDASVRAVDPDSKLDFHLIVACSAAFSPDGTRVVATRFEYATLVSCTLDHPRNGRMPRMLGGTTEWISVFSPDGARISTEGGDPLDARGTAAQVWDAATGQPVPLSPAQDTVVSVEFTADGPHIVTTSADPTAPIVTSVAFSADGTRILTTSSDHTVRIWNAATGQPLSPPLRHASTVRSAALSPDGTRIATGDDHGTARMWNATTGQPLPLSLVHQDWVNGIAFSPDGGRLVTASGDHTASVWNAVTGQRVAGPLRHQDVVVSVAFSPDGARVVTASADHTARVWNAATGQPLTPPLEHQAGVQSAAFSPDGTRIVTVDATLDPADRPIATRIQVWDATTGKPLAPPLDQPEVAWTALRVGELGCAAEVSAEPGARAWDLPLAPGTLTDWSAVGARSPYVLVHGVLMRRNAAPASRAPAQP